MTTTPDPLEAIFAYRVFDLRDRFPGNRPSITACQ